MTFTRYSTYGNMLSKLWSNHCRCMLWFGKRRAAWHGALQEAASLVAKAEVLQASIGVSCNEIDIQTTKQDHSDDASEDAHAESSFAIQDGARIEGGVQAILADDVPCRDSGQALPPCIDLLTGSADGSLVWPKSMYRYKSLLMKQPFAQTLMLMQSSHSGQHASCCSTPKFRS